MKRVGRHAVPLVLAAALAACRTPDPKQEVEVREVETYWAIDRAVGERQYLAPVVRFRLHNKAPMAQRSIQATAVFRRKGEEEQTWGTDWQQVAPAGKPLQAGRDLIVSLKSDGRYYSNGSPESMFQHKLFKDAKVEVFVRIGSSGWVKLVEAEVERRIGSRSLQNLSPPSRE